MSYVYAINYLTAYQARAPLSRCRRRRGRGHRTGACRHRRRGLGHRTGAGCQRRRGRGHRPEPWESTGQEHRRVGVTASPASPPGPSPRPKPEVSILANAPEATPDAGAGCHRRRGLGHRTGACYQRRRGWWPRVGACRPRRRGQR